MRHIIFTFYSLVLLMFFSFGFSEQMPKHAVLKNKTDENIKLAETVSLLSDTGMISLNDSEQTSQNIISNASMPVRGVNASDFIEYAKKFIGTPYVWGSVDPRVGFDCSGFVNHVSEHFGIGVPRSSVQFTQFGIDVSLNLAKPGDLILFTGTNPEKRVVGHMGIITENPGGEPRFIHSTSGKTKGVTISELTDHYKQRFVKVIRIFPFNDNIFKPYRYVSIPGLPPFQS